MSQKTILITGSSRGIGKAIAQKAYQEGYKLILHGRTDSDALKKVHRSLEGSEKIVFDLANTGQIAEQIKQLPSIDILVNNAGVAHNFLSDISEFDDEAALKEYKVNVLGMINCIKMVLPAMLDKKSGSIINIASMKGHPNLSTLSPFSYGITKAGVISLTKSLAKKYSDKGVRVNSISPGYVDTDILQRYTPEIRQSREEKILLNRFAEPAEIAEIVSFLASEKASYITGQDILVDGGYSLKGK